MRLLAIFVIALFLYGCVNPQVTELKQWATTTKGEAQNGNMKWSDYYKQLYYRVSNLPEMQGKAFYLRGANVLIDAALAMEEGRISKEQFDSFQRSMVAAESQYAEDVQRQNAAALQQAAATYNNFLQSQALQAQTWRASTPIICNSQKMGSFVNTTCQ